LRWALNIIGFGLIALMWWSEIRDWLRLLGSD